MVLEELVRSQPRTRNSGAAKYMERHGAFGIMVTLVWMYIEMLQLLAKMNNR